MISTPTVLILGAGASIPYGFPDGWTLKNDIWQSILTKDHCFRKLKEQGFHEEDLAFFAERLKYSGEMSIDAFLERCPTFQKMGKRAIAVELIKYEHPMRLTPRKLDNGHWSAWQWYHHLFEKLTMGLEPATFNQNKLAVITFNYDRSLEEFLFKALRITFAESEEQALALLKLITIKHVHGMLSPYDPLGMGFGRRYTTRSDEADIRLAAESIRIISDDNDSAFVEAREKIGAAERICFLGFGYHPDNCRRLRISYKQRVHGTVYGLTRQEFTTKVMTFFKHQAEGKFLDPLMPVNQCTNIDYLRHYFPLEL